MIKQQYWDEIFSKCDFHFAADLLIHTFAGGIVPKDLGKHLSAYTNNPCRETAISLIEFDSDEILKFFVNNETALASMMSTKYSDRKELSNDLRNNNNLLMKEPEFKDYCDSYLVNDPDKMRNIAKTNEDLLIAKGYSKETISDTFSEYMANLED